MGNRTRTIAGHNALFSGSVRRMSDGYYSGDQPNATLGAFIENRHPEATDSPFGPDTPSQPRAITTHRSTPLFLMHSYWSKKPHAAVRAYVEHYTRPGEIVLDPFCGTGGTALMAISLGRAAIAIDVSPAATFIARGYCTPVDVHIVERAFRRVLETVRKQGGWLYETRTPDGQAARILSVHSSLRIRCPKCLTPVSLLSCKEVDGERVCPTPRCNEPITSSGDKCGYNDDFIQYTTRSGRHGAKVKPFPTQSTSFDAKLAARIAATPSPQFASDFRFPEKARIQSFPARGIYTLRDLYSPRNWLAMNLLRDEILREEDENIRHALMLLFTAICLKTSKCMGLNSDGVGRIQKHGLSPQSVALDVNVFDFFEIAWTSIAKGWNEINDIVQCSDLVISTQDARSLLSIPPNSIDYVFTDPPYGDRVQFWESNVIWELWLGFDYRWKDREIIVNRVRGLSEMDWQAGIRDSMKECFRVLKPGRWITLTYNDDDITWTLLQDAMLEVGFVPDKGTRAIYMETITKSEKQMRRGENNTQRDLVINFRKPSASELPAVVKSVLAGTESPMIFKERVASLVAEFLQEKPGGSSIEVREHVISHLVRRGALQPHDFDAILREVAERGTDAHDAWFVKDSIESDEIEPSEMAKEDVAALVIQAFIKKSTAKSHDEGVRYYNLFEHYLYSVNDKPRRALVDWLADYFYKTEEGTWRLPASEEERELKTRARASGTNRRIKRFASMLETGVPIPSKKVPTSASLVEWIRHAKRAGLFDIGKLLYERGGVDMDRLPEQVQIEVEEDYQVCVRALQRVTGGAADSGNRRGGRGKPRSGE